MRLVEDADALQAAVTATVGLAQRAFGNGAVYLERYVRQHGTSKFRCSDLATAKLCTYSTAIVRSNEGIRRLSRKRSRQG